MSLKNFMSYDDAATVLGEYADKVNELKSGLTNYQTQNDINLEVPDRKNILNLSFEKIKALCDEGTWTGTSYVYNGVTFVFTVVDGYITKISISGTLTGNRSRVWIAYDEDMTNYNGCILNGCPDLGGIDYISIQIQKKGTPYTTYAVDTGSGANINNISDNCQIYISIGASFDSQTPVDVYPMIRPATITDSTFAPYIPSVESRIEAVESGLSNLIKKYEQENVSTGATGYIVTNYDYETVYKVKVKRHSDGIPYYTLLRASTQGRCVVLVVNDTLTAETNQNVDITIYAISNA